MGQTDETTLVARYRAYYGLPPDVYVSVEMIQHHWTLERELTMRLLSSVPDERWRTFEDCYTRLYSELPWLDQSVGLADRTPAAQRFRTWTDLLGTPPKSIYEVGSGHADMLRYLVSLGYHGKATEITRERGNRGIDEAGALEWGATDGVHLNRFETLASWDYVISNQVLEHLHPDDLVEHLRSARAILAEGGEYILSVPHRYQGPSDVSALFGADVACGMHLKEYTYREMLRALQASGYSRVWAAFGIPHRLNEVLGLHFAVRRSTVYLGWVVLIETVIGLVPSQRMRRCLMRCARILRGPNGVLVVARRYVSRSSEHLFFACPGRGRILRVGGTVLASGVRRIHVLRRGGRVRSRLRSGQPTSRGLSESATMARIGDFVIKSGARERARPNGIGSAESGSAGMACPASADGCASKAHSMAWRRGFSS